MYYIDNLCIHPGYRKKGIAPKLIQTLYYNLRKNNTLIITYLFKREGKQNAFVPLVSYFTYGFSSINLPNLSFPSGQYTLLEITNTNFILFKDLINKEKKKYKCVIMPDITNIVNLIKVKNIFIYGILYNNTLISSYIFRDAKVRYTPDNPTHKTISDKSPNTLECICSIGSVKDNNIFFAGFCQAVHRCNKENLTTNILVEETSLNKIIINNINNYNIPYFIKSPTSFFLYNYACYSVASDKCLLLY
jgi:hypothetical protein